MTEQQTPTAVEAPQPPKKTKGPATHEQKQKRRKIIRRTIAAVVAVAILAGGGWALKKFVFTEDENGLGEPMTQPVMRGSIQAKVAGSGTARAKNAAVVTPESGYTVLELFVKEGDTVEEGQLLYNLDDTAAQDAVRSAQQNVLSAQENVRKAQELVTQDNRDLSSLYEDMEDLTITAPHAGKLTDVNRDIKVGDDLTEGTAVATVINDTKLRLRLYYSWAYEGQIQVGQSARITLPSSMAEYPGTVEAVNYVKRVVPEGSVTFEVVFVMDNPGTLTENMTASASLTDANGVAIYPYESGKLEYFETTKLIVKEAGPVEFVSLMNYADVTAGQTLVKLGDKDLQDKISDKRETLRQDQKSVDDQAKAVETAQKAVEEAQKKLENYHATSPISGKILSLGGLITGEVVPSGAGIQIADTATMIVDIQIDEMKIGYVSTGMMVDLQDMMGNYYMGTIETVALQATAENGVAAFPATVVVDNYDGMLMTNSYVDYSFVASQSDDCLLVPIQAVMNVTLPGEDGAMGGGQDMMPAVDDMVPVGDDVEPADDTPEDDGTEPADDGAEPADDGTELADDGTEPVDGGAEPAGNVVAVPAGDVVVIPEGTVPQAAVAISMAGPGFSTTQGASAFSTPGTATVCFVQGEPDERAIEADESWEMPEGFFAVKVTTGLSDEQNVEITSGLREGDVVFYGYMTDSAYAGW